MKTKVTPSIYNQIKKQLKNHTQTYVVGKTGLCRATISKISVSKNYEDYLSRYKKSKKKTLFEKIKAIFS